MVWYYYSVVNNGGGFSWLCIAVGSNEVVRGYGYYESAFDFACSGYCFSAVGLGGLFCFRVNFKYFLYITLSFAVCSFRFGFDSFTNIT